MKTRKSRSHPRPKEEVVGHFLEVTRKLNCKSEIQFPCGDDGKRSERLLDERRIHREEMRRPQLQPQAQTLTGT